MDNIREVARKSSEAIIGKTIDIVVTSFVKKAVDFEATDIVLQDGSIGRVTKVNRLLGKISYTDDIGGSRIVRGGDIVDFISPFDQTHQLFTVLKEPTAQI